MESRSLTIQYAKVTGAGSRCSDRGLTWVIDRLGAHGDSDPPFTGFRLLR
jgi:hypothetical protein